MFPLTNDVSLKVERMKCSTVSTASVLPQQVLHSLHVGRVLVQVQVQVQTPGSRAELRSSRSGPQHSSPEPCGVPYGEDNQMRRFRLWTVLPRSCISWCSDTAATEREKRRRRGREGGEREEEREGEREEKRGREREEREKRRGKREGERLVRLWTVLPRSCISWCSETALRLRERRDGGEEEERGREEEIGGEGGEEEEREREVSQTLDGPAAVVHQLVLRHRSTAEKENKKGLREEGESDGGEKYFIIKT
ncbi:hypothetical protein WMY93_033570 [Mugilogobius chulae]|uniref:Uncharacterized protein n=1 Tax=Mugilogobius chulae TaxID=88201 RepID=A0AAW0MN60_9GOBI